MRIFSRLIPLCFFGIIMLSKCDNNSQVPVEAQYQAYCGSCHSVPDPKHVTKALCGKNILPEMAARMGYKAGN